MENHKILIADDEEDVLAVMAKKIAMEGYEVVKAVDGEDAWQKIQDENPDIIILDLNMPKMTGFEVLENLRKAPSTEKWQPVIIVSARTELEDMHKGFSLQADHYMTKPCSMSDVLKSIKMMINLIPQHKQEKIDSSSS
jgi:DNA-binding response OmpR family regulator